MTIRNSRLYSLFKSGPPPRNCFSLALRGPSLVIGRIVVPIGLIRLRLKIASSVLERLSLCQELHGNELRSECGVVFKVAKKCDNANEVLTFIREDVVNVAYKRALFLAQFMTVVDYRREPFGLMPTWNSAVAKRLHRMSMQLPNDPGDASSKALLASRIIELASYMNKPGASTLRSSYSGFNGGRKFRARLLALAQRDGHVEDESVVMLRALDSLIPRISLHDFDVMVQARHRSCTAVELVAINGNQVVTANQKDVAVAFGREWLDPRVMVAVRAHELFLGKPFDANCGHNF